MSASLNSTFLYPSVLALSFAFSNILHVVSIPMTFPFVLTILTAKKTSVPAPEPKSTTLSFSFIWTNFIRLPHSTPKIGLRYD